MTEENEERAACVCGSEGAPGLGHCSGCEVYWQGRKKAEDDAERVGQLEEALRAVDHVLARAQAPSMKILTARDSIAAALAGGTPQQGELTKEGT